MKWLPEQFTESIYNNQKFILVILLTYIDVYLYFFCMLGNSDTWQNVLIAIEFYLITVFFTIVIIAALYRILPRFPFRILQTFFSLLCIFMLIVDGFLSSEFGEVFDAGKLKIILTADDESIVQFIMLYVSAFMKKLLLLSMGFLGFVSVIVYLRKRMKNIQETIHRIIKKYLALFIVLPVSLTLLFIPMLKCDVIGIVAGIIFATPVMRFSAALYNGLPELVTASKADATFASQDERIVALDNNPAYVVFVLGESMNRQSLMCYGNEHANTPRINARVADSNMILFQDVIAPANNTSDAQKLLWTFAEKGDTKEWYKNADLIDVMKTAEYHTYWLSNQSPISFYGNEDRIFANRSDESFFGNTLHEEYSKKNCKDGVLLPILDECLSQDYDNNFIVMHLEGEHEIFKLRYPPEFDQFKADNEDGIDEKQRQTKAEYDNAILYTDYILDEIIRRFERRDAVVIYIPDHGLEVYNNRDFVGHSSEDIGNRNMIEIPMLIWGSDQYWQKRPGLKEKIKSAVNRPYMTDDIIHTVLDLAGVQSTSYDPTKSIINSRFDASRVRMYHGEPYQREDDD